MAISHPKQSSLAQNTSKVLPIMWILSFISYLCSTPVCWVAIFNNCSLQFREILSETLLSLYPSFFFFFFPEKTALVYWRSMTMIFILAWCTYYSDMTLNVTSDVFHIMSFEGCGKNIATKTQSFTYIHYSGLNGHVLFFDQLFRQMTVAVLLQYWGKGHQWTKLWGKNGKQREGFGFVSQKKLLNMVCSSY